MITAVNTEHNASFRAIQLSEIDMQKSRKIFNILSTALISETEKSRAKTKLFNIFDSYIKSEAKTKTKYFNIFKDVLSEMYLKFAEIMNDAKNCTCESIIEKLNEYKPSKDTIKPEYVHRTLNVSIYNDSGKKQKIDILTEKSLPVPESAIVNDKYRRKIDTTIDNSSVSDKIKKRLRERANGKIYKDIAASENVSVKSIGHTIRKAIIQIQHKYGILPPDIIERAKHISKYLGCSEEDFIRAGMNTPGLFYKTFENYDRNIERMSEFLGCTPKEYIEKYLTNSNVFCSKPEALEKRIKIENYYKKVKNKPGKNVIRRESEKSLYNKILAYLIQKYSKDNPKINIINVRQFDLETFLKSLPKRQKIFRYEIPNDEIAPEFIKYVQDTSVKTIGKNLFKFKITG